MTGQRNPMHCVDMHCVHVPKLIATMAVLLLIGCGRSEDLVSRSTKPSETSETIEPSAPQPAAPQPAAPQPAAPQSTDAEAETEQAKPESESPMLAVGTDAASVMEQPDVATSVAGQIDDSKPETPPADPSADEVELDDLGPAATESQEPLETMDDGVPTIEPCFRIFLPTTSGPLVVDVELRIGDQPLQTAFDDRIRAVIEGASDAGSELTWTRLFEHVAADPEQFGRSSPINSQQYKDVIRRYDKNRNKKPDQDEVAKFLFRDAPYAGPFRLTGSDYFREINRSLSAVFAAIDRNDNRVLESEEIDRAGESLRKLDQNADQRIDFDEVVAFAADDNPAWKKRRSSRWGAVATDLSGYIDWSMLSYTLDEFDSLGPFGLARNVVAKLDQDHSDSIDRDEARGLLSVESDFRLLVRYPLVASGAAEIVISSVSEDLDPLVQRVESANRIAILGSALRLTASVLDARTGRNQIPFEAFAMLDANNDGGLDESEIPAPALREYSFEDLDQDEDGKLTLREINEGMNPKSPIWNVQVRARGAESPDGVFAWLDQNQDHFLSTREVMAAKDRLRAIASPEGNVKPADIPDSYQIQFGRGEPNQDNQLFGLTRPPSAASDSRPRWAQAMDINRDGDISSQEFPGTTAQFTNLDVNQDGFINSEEISAK
jgi:Ca2+-binding EF-hand superfamily protein